MYFFATFITNVLSPPLGLVQIPQPPLLHAMKCGTTPSSGNLSSRAGGKLGRDAMVGGDLLLGGHFLGMGNGPRPTCDKHGKIRPKLLRGSKWQNTGHHTLTGAYINLLGFRVGVFFVLGRYFHAEELHKIHIEEMDRYWHFVHICRSEIK